MHTNKIDKIDFKAKFCYRTSKKLPYYLKGIGKEFEKNTSEFQNLSLVLERRDYDIHYFSLKGLNNEVLASSKFKLPNSLFKKHHWQEDDNIKLINQKYAAYHLSEVFKSLISKITK